MALGLAAAVATGVLVAPNGSDDAHRPRQTAPQRTRNQAPFDQALARLAAARGLRYKETANGITRRDITVTPSGTLLGSTGDGGAEAEADVLRIGGKTFTRPRQAPDDETPDDETPEDEAPDGEAPDGQQQDPDAPGRWTIDRGGSGIGPVLARFLPPAELALRLSDALDRVRDLPDPDDPDLPSVRVHGVPALRADTPAGRLFVTRNKPYRVLRLEPYGPSGRPGQLSRLERRHKGATPSAVPWVATNSLVNDGSQGMDLSPVSGGRADAMYDSLEAAAKQLAHAVDSGIDFTPSTNDGNVSCGSGGCTVSQDFTGALTSDAKAHLTGGTVTAVMRATVTIDGQDAGGCTSPRSTFPLTGNTVSGTLTCSVPGAGAVYAAVDARYRAQAEAESQASGEPPVPYRILYAAHPVVSAAALSTGEADKLVKRVQRERRDRDGRCATGNTSPRAPAPGAPGGRSHRTDSDRASYVLADEAPVLVRHDDDAPRDFPNRIAEDKPQWFQQISPGQALARSGNYAYVVLENGELVIGKRTAGHVSLAQGGRVLAAGEFTTKGGAVVRLDNKSGHYRPYGAHARKAAVDAFDRNGLSAEGKYVDAWGRPDC
ncbi:hypothetical protein ACWC2K_22975 [Streptomyces chattanoogensis]|uniref:hypothetical protein n=1 Tax=Streptomyces chattanoogensis TaxID=66876 RepID=UPI003695BD41